MKKLLYVAPVILDFKKLNGVAKKVLNHYKVFCKFYKAEMIAYGTNCLYYFHDDTIDEIPLKGLNRRLKLYLFIKSALISKEYQCVYIRYHLSDLLFVYVLRLLKERKAKIVIEIPTYPYKKELLKSKKGSLRYFVDISSRLFLKLYVGRVVTYSDHVNIFGIQTINTINGVIYDDLIPSQKSVYSETEINLISVSVTMSCHGYDRLIEGLYNYYKNNRKIAVYYHLVGDGIEISNYKRLVKKYGLEKYVKFYDFKVGDELDEIYNKSDIAINSLAIHRIGLKTESTIKSKEYAAKGLPMVSSYAVDAFSPEDNEKYVLKISSDDSAVQVDQLVLFYKQLYQKDSANVSVDIRKASQMRCDMVNTLTGIMNYFNTGI
ncbi:glycosyltransferase [Flavobacterium aquiphilum]|uniref:glycosyltransferase n=1 Tax=Flavobacterium aquiphilum TaxID=3003261 RepID=UPI0024807E42|nr:glycosyltransferase [Flavobacterium aquiphilum]